ncbi:MAG: Xaa-Pro peptidase family protein [Nitrolancea sp.]
MPQLRLSDAEYQRHRDAILSKLADRGLEGLICFNPNNVRYFCRWGFIPTERPIAYALTPTSSALLVPRLEEEHAAEFVIVDKLRSYPEYPGDRHPMQFFKDILIELGLEHAKIGVDADGYGGIYGYRGPRVSELLPDATVQNVADDIEYLEMINSPEELTLIAESARWGNLAHVYLQEVCKVGITETEISMRASFEASQTMIRTLGPTYRPVGAGSMPAHAGFRGQIGKDSALPHAMTSNAKLKAGDVLVTGAGADVWGYGSELERTMIMGEPTPEQERYFNFMFQAQTLALDAIKPGVKCSDVDNAVHAFFDAHDLNENWRHHTGHAKSTLIHEAPFLDTGDDRVIEVGMVFTVEPGIYVPGFGGFRHSDTVVVTETGIESITYYPRDLESLIIPV